MSTLIYFDVARLSIAASALFAGFIAGSFPVQTALAAREQAFASSDGTAILAEGLAAERVNQLERAENLFRQASILPETQEKGVISLSRVLAARQKPREAAQTLKEYLTSVNPFSVDGHLQLLDIDLTLEDAAGADAEINVVARLRPGYEPFQERRAILAFRSGDFKKVISSLGRVLKNDPKHVQALSLRYQTYLKLNRLDLAAKDVEQLIELQPAHVDNYSTLSEIYARSGNYDRAVTTLKRAIEKNQFRPEDQVKLVTIAANAYSQISEILIRNGELSSARELIQESLNLKTPPGSPKAKVFFSAARLMAAQGNAAGAERFYAKAFEAYPRMSESGLRLSELQANRGAYETSAATLKKLLILNPESDEAARELVDVYNKANRKDSLGGFLKNYVDSYPSKTWALVEYVKLLSSIGNTVAAESALRHATDDNESAADNYLVYVKFLDGQRRYADAIEVLNKAIAEYPKDGRLRFDLGLCHEFAGSMAKAEQAYRSVPVADAELYYQAHVNLALLQEKNGEFAKAITTLTHLRSKIGTSDALTEKIRVLSQKSQPGGDRSIATEVNQP